jgi:fatty acid desaturase
MSRFTCRSTARALLTIAADYALIVGAIASAALRDKGWTGLGWGTTALTVVIIGTRQYALGEALLHEASHCHLSTSKRVNDLMGAILAWPVFTSLAAYRRFHNRLHHEVDIADEKNSIWEDYESWGLPPPSRKLSHALAFWLFVLRPAVGLTGVMHLIKTVRDFGYDFDLRETRLMLAAWAAVIASAAYFSFWRELILYWLIPYAFVFSTLNYWSEVGDHFRVSGAKTRSDLNWFVNTFVSHNIGYHALHHKYSSVPWFHLPEAYCAHKAEILEQVSHGYWETFTQIIAYTPPHEERLEPQTPDVGRSAVEVLP